MERKGKRRERNHDTEWDGKDWNGMGWNGMAGHGRARNITKQKQPPTSNPKFSFTYMINQRGTREGISHLSYPR